MKRVPTLVDRVSPDRDRPRRLHSVSVVIPCYNYGRYLPGAVESVLSQRDVRVEVIVVDDKSTDGSAKVALALAEDDQRVRVLLNPENQGHVRTFNTGLAHATGEFVVRLDADDLLTPGSLARAVALFEAHPSVGLVYGHPRHFEAEPPPVPQIGAVTWTVWPGIEWVHERCRRGNNCVTTPEAMVRASVFERVGDLNTALRFAQDMEMWLRAASVSDVGHVNGADQALHRDHPDSMSATDGAGVMTDIVERREVFRQLFGRVSVWLPSAPQLASLARRTLAREAHAHAAYLCDRGRVDDPLINELVDFADATYPGADRLPSARTLRLRRQLGVRVLRRDPSAPIRIAMTRMRENHAYARWTRHGL